MDCHQAIRKLARNLHRKAHRCCGRRSNICSRSWRYIFGEEKPRGDEEEEEEVKLGVE